MARARNIKPGFFTNDQLVELPFEFRLLFIGLWTLADREGRLIDRPKKIRMELFPADNVDCEAGLSMLQEGGFIDRYSVDGLKVIQVINWNKHQSPHVREAASELPSNGTITANHDAEHSLGGACALPRPPDSLIPDSLIPDSLKQNLSSPAEPDDATGDGGKKPNGRVHPIVPDTPHEALIDLYHAALPELPSVKAWGDKRSKALKKTWRWLLTARRRSGERFATSTQEGLDWFRRYFEHCAKSDFLMGRAGDKWQADLEWLVNYDNVVKVIEGRYHPADEVAK